GGGRGAALGQFLEDDSRVEARERRATDVVTHDDGAEAEGRRLAQRFDGEHLAFVPFARERHHFLSREGARDRGACALLLGKLEVHPVTPVHLLDGHVICFPPPAYDRIGPETLSW